jgi:hypothetical protein
MAPLLSSVAAGHGALCCCGFALPSDLPEHQSTVPAVGKEHSTRAFVSIPKICFLYLGQVEYVE